MTAPEKQKGCTVVRPFFVGRMGNHGQKNSEL